MFLLSLCARNSRLNPGSFTGGYEWSGSLSVRGFLVAGSASGSEGLPLGRSLGRRVGSERDTSATEELALEQDTSLIDQRRQKLDKIREMGFQPYPYRFGRTHTSSTVKRDFETLESSKTLISLAGRMMSVRRHGRAGFGHIQDEAGRIQIYLRKDTVREREFALYRLVDMGDIVGVTGTAFKTRTGEITVAVERFEILSKSLRPLPIVKEKIEADEHKIYDAFSDKEQRYRQRYVDLVLNPEVRETFRKRTRIISVIRRFLDERGFMEVETPILQPIYGGASARPFTTYHHALGLRLYLRISNELYLKRLIVGGYEKVYEFSRDFRNEGMDRSHNPEFTLLEIYQAYTDYTDMMKLTEEMISTVAAEVTGSMVTEYRGEKIDLTPPWPRVAMLDSIEEHTGINLRGVPEDELRTICRNLEVEVDGSVGAGKMIDGIFEKFVQNHLVQPTFIVDYPVETSPLAKRHRDDPTLTERFEPFIYGEEIGNAFSELNDPMDQRARFEDQMRLKKLGDEEAQILDEDFLRALEYGMPPTGGLGIGVDRVVMLLTNAASIRDVIFFPQMRPEKVAK